MTSNAGGEAIQVGLVTEAKALPDDGREYAVTVADVVKDEVKI